MHIYIYIEYEFMCVYIYTDSSRLSMYICIYTCFIYIYTQIDRYMDGWIEAWYKVCSSFFLLEAALN